jgi:UDP-N-acetylmuramoyl-L-alanyl-D-glutamate--2,6-diaminopimelate ligase
MIFMKIHLSKLLPVQEDVEISSVVSDSREVTQGSLFLACSGATVDGRDYISQALKQGASAVCYAVDDDYVLPALDANVPVIGMPGLQHQLGEIAARFYQDPSDEMTVVGITGTNGKTSCTQFLAQALEKQRQRCAVMGTLGHGFLPDLKQTPLTTADAVSLQKDLATLKQQGADSVAMEVSSHSLVQGRVNGVHFDIAVFTQLSRDHLDYHGDMQTYASAKAKLFQQPGLEYGVVNIDDPIGRRLAEEYGASLNIVTYSAQGHTQSVWPAVVATHVEPLEQGFKVQVTTPWGDGEFITSLLGRFNISNLLAVLSVLGIMKVTLPKMLSALEAITTAPGRMQLFKADNMPSVVVDYAHTPDALEKSLAALREHCKGKLWCVFGCGGDRDKGKRPQMAAIVEQGSDHVIVTNDNPRSESPEQIAEEIRGGFSRLNEVTVELDRACAIKRAVHSAMPQDTVLIAGKGHEATQTMDGQVFDFSDIEHVKSLLFYR